MHRQEAEQLIEQLRTYQKEVLANRESALFALERAGLITRDGEPAPFYSRNLKNFFGDKKMDEIEVVDSYLFTCINLQLCMSSEKVPVRTLYDNFRKHSVTKGFDLSEFNYSNFINFLEAHREEFGICEGEIGVRVNLVGAKKQ